MKNSFINSHLNYHYSITIYTEDEAILNCLRALSQYSQKTGNVRIPWGGTTKKDWLQSKMSVTFRFSDPSYREFFVEEITRLLDSSLWKIITQKDNDPASPQNK